MKTDARTTICKDRKNKGIIEEGHKRKIDDEQEYEVHLQTERERRKKMKDRFTELHDLIPNISAKVSHGNPSRRILSLDPSKSYML
ncbi:hypothetical protein MLD38_013786 [Melastoma candidum]|uniref:Uncharacterized protein n=1 Tax=Melastoma candidum TaxID=119954 RepID=A0ACB9RED3_9MYRT|nr:hypothetical protein MLD38_013786 [Melastoma candidum]